MLDANRCGRWDSNSRARARGREAVYSKHKTPKPAFLLHKNPSIVPPRISTRFSAFHYSTSNHFLKALYLAKAIRSNVRYKPFIQCRRHNRNATPGKKSQKVLPGGRFELARAPYREWPISFRDQRFAIYISPNIADHRKNL